ncbi:hypothetical protein CJ217_04460 [Streptococcus sp. UMB1385]|nr:hypothetical protein CJ217_04460 [Streptococcus sp. UMB1385]
MKEFHYDYVTRIIDWAKDRDIKDKGRLTKQLLKSDEENAELQNAIESYENGNKDALIQIKDSIGDIYVTLVVSTYLVSERPYLTFRKIKTSKQQTANVSWLYYIRELKSQDAKLFDVFTNTEANFIDIEARLSSYINFLEMVAQAYGLELVECIKYAYDTISKRKGKMIDGTFIKEN